MRIELKIEADPSNQKDAAMLTALMALFATFAKSGGSAPATSFAAVAATHGAPVATGGDVVTVCHPSAPNVAAEFVNTAVVPPAVEGDGGVCAPAATPVAPLSVSTKTPTRTRGPGRPRGDGVRLEPTGETATAHAAPSLFGALDTPPAPASVPESVTAPPVEGSAPVATPATPPVSAYPVAVTPLTPAASDPTPTPATVPAHTATGVAAGLDKMGRHTLASFAALASSGAAIALADLHQAFALVSRAKTLPDRGAHLNNLMLHYGVAGLSNLPVEKYPEFAASLVAIHAKIPA